MDRKTIEEIVRYSERRSIVIGAFTILLALPFVFAILGYLDLKKCQANPSNACPVLYNSEK